MIEDNKVPQMWMIEDNKVPQAATSPHIHRITENTLLLCRQNRVLTLKNSIDNGSIDFSERGV